MIASGEAARVDRSIFRGLRHRAWAVCLFSVFAIGAGCGWLGAAWAHELGFCGVGSSSSSDDEKSGKVAGLRSRCWRLLAWLFSLRSQDQGLCWSLPGRRAARSFVPLVRRCWWWCPLLFVLRLECEFGALLAGLWRWSAGAWGVTFVAVLALALACGCVGHFRLLRDLKGGFAGVWLWLFWL